MSARETLVRFSAALLCDEKILSAREKELLAELLQRITTQPGKPSEEAHARIAFAVGQLIIERASAVVGESVVRQLSPRGAPEADRSWLREQLQAIEDETRLGSRAPSPDPPNAVPRAPGPLPPVQDPGPRPPSPGPGPGISLADRHRVTAGSPVVGPPSPNPPGSVPRPPSPGPGISRELLEQPAQTAVLERRDFLSAKCVIFEEFLAPAELRALTGYVLECEKEFAASEVVAPGAPEGLVEWEHRRSRVLMELGPHREVILNRLEKCLPQALKRLGRDLFPISRIEAQVTASNDGDYFRWHTDNGQNEVASREITFVYFFHREPRPFRGGELRLYDSQLKNGAYVPASEYRAIVPQQNQMVLFVSSLAHEITPVESPEASFADSRFTVNGWLNR